MARHCRQVSGAIDYIWRSLDRSEALTLDLIAKQVHMAPHHFHRVFREITGNTLRQFIMSLRLHRAAHRLLFSTDSVTQIAVEAGYTHEAFCRLFRSLFNACPTSYRRRNWDPPRPCPPLSDLHLRRSLPAGLDFDVQPAQAVAFVQHFGPASSIPEAWRRLRLRLEARQIPLQQVRAVGIVYDDPGRYLGGHLRYDACAVMANDFQPIAGTGELQLPPCRCIALRHQGPLQTMVHTYLQMLARWAADRHVEELRPLPYHEVYERFPEGDVPGVPAVVHVPLKPAEPPLSEAV